MTYTDSSDDDPYAALPPDPGTEPVDPTAAEQDPEFMAQLARRYRNPAAGMGVQPDAPVSAESDILPLAAGAAGTLLSHIGQGYASMGRGIGNAVSGAYGSLKEALAAYANGDNAAPPAVVDAAMQKAADKLGPNADKSKVVQAAIAGTADPLSPDYMNQAGRDVFGGAGGSTTIGQAPARTGYDQTQAAAPNRADRLGVTQLPAPYGLTESVDSQGNITYPNTPTGRQKYAKDTGQGYDPANDYRRIAPAAPAAPLTQQQLIRQGMTPEAAARVIEDNGGMVDALGPKLNRYLPPGFLNDPYNRAQLSELTTRRGEPMSGSGEGGRRLSKADYLEPGGNSGIYESLADQLLNRANNHAAVLAGNTNAPSDRFNPWGADQTQQAQQTPALQRQVESGYNPSNMQQALLMRAAGTLPSDIRRQQDMRNLTYDPTGAQEAPEPPMRSSGDGGGGTSRNTNRNTKTRAPAARGRRSDLDTGTEAPVQTAMADSGTMSDASNDIRSTVPAGAQVAAAGQTGYANQPPAPGGFSGAAGPSTDVAVRPGAFTPAGAAPAAPTAPAAPGDYPQGYKLVPVTGGQYDRALVGPDGQVVNYVRKGEAPPSPETVSAKVRDDASNDNREEFFRRLRAGEPTGIDLNQYARHGYNFSQPLPPRQAPTTQSMADRNDAIRQSIIQDPSGSRVPLPQTQQAGGLPPPPQPTGNKVTDAYNLEVWKEQAIAARGAGSQQNAVNIAQQKATATAAAAALHTFDTGQQTLIRSIYTKANSQGEDSLTPNEKALRDEYVDRIRQHSRSQSGGQQGAAPGIRSTLQNAAGGQQPVRVNSMADAARLPRGTQFLDPNGNLRTVP